MTKQDIAWTLVTGSAKRLGAAIAIELAKRGHHIVIHYNQSEEDAHNLAVQIKKSGQCAETIQGDFSTPESLQDFIQRYQARFLPTKYLVNNVGNYEMLPTSKTPSSVAYALFQTNVHAPLQLCQALLPTICKLQGSIVNIGTVGIHEAKVLSKSGVYMATKTALWSLTKSLAKEYAHDQVSINMVSPGELTISVSLPKDLARLPMKRAGTPEEVARLIAFLFEPENRYITAQNIEVAGAFGL